MEEYQRRNGKKSDSFFLTVPNGEKRRITWNIITGALSYNLCLPGRTQIYVTGYRVGNDFIPFSDDHYELMLNQHVYRASPKKNGHYV